jgi:hypothetical protein
MPSVTAATLPVGAETSVRRVPAGRIHVPDIRNLEELAEYAYQQVERIQRMQSNLEGQFGTAESPRRFAGPAPDPAAHCRNYTSTPARCG